MKKGTVSKRYSPFSVSWMGAKIIPLQHMPVRPVTGAWTLPPGNKQVVSTHYELRDTTLLKSEVSGFRQTSMDTMHVAGRCSVYSEPYLPGTTTTGSKRMTDFFTKHFRSIAEVCVV
ncbi:hypothetical protein [Salibacterium lacus]|uniref:Uncharacterized protein n=1 Tax=Salibacterium lacus TaxID=1898109 RepID=A0ABW5SW46_9BACI